ncbi:MAG: KilA-N domain-containing protein [Opitutaceae bacterium]|nr:KilA-N domain-containing protein [Opitutaceae bacterium]
MSQSARRTIQVQGASVAVISRSQQDVFCLTNIAKFKNPDHPDDIIRNWLRSRSTVEFLGVWERLNNPGFNPVEFDGIRMQTSLNSFVLTPKEWIEKTGAVRITSSAGRYGGTYAHKDIAFEFASWVSVEFKLYLIGMNRRDR